ncbi:pathogen-associated molecular patterns-induced protein A70-like [Typha latifolia]|uniref:pathogen-associated molecular patterns-induced protein A70-like n=1 Tax=Typha latifolia TaxID=4733 RepID=UPI003C2DC500
MMDECLPLILESVLGWLTPTVLFVFINLVIGTIAVTSRSNHRDQDRPPLLRRAPSYVLERLRSFNLPSTHSETLAWFHPSPQPDPVAAPPVPAAEEQIQKEKHCRQRRLVRSKSEGNPTVGMRKPASETPEFARFEEERAADGDSTPEDDGESGEGEDGEVDARANDFISRFRQQLRLQRLASIMRRREMLSIGAAA